MNKIDDGGFAYPQHGWSGDPETVARMQANGGGLTIRDVFAAAALQGLLACSRIHEIADGHKSEAVMACTAEWSYKLADAMIAARKADSK